MEILLIGGIIFAIFTALLAKKQGRSVGLAAVLGFCFGIFALIGYAIAGESEEKKVERMRRIMR